MSVDEEETSSKRGAESAGGPKLPFVRFLPLILLAAAIAGFFVLGLDKYLTFDALRENRTTLGTFVAEQGVIAVALYIAIYTISVALSVPGASILTIAGGLLFGQWFGSVYVVFGATMGAVGVFLIAKTALGDALRRRAGPAMRKMEAGFQENALSYLLVLRLIPLFPFFLVNIVPAFLGVKLRTYAVGTFIGIIPGSFVYATVGAGLGSIFEQNDEFSLSGVLTPEITAALVGLAVLALLPVAYKKFRKSKN
jgi:uncharacterized membrane protein YdjX (TVP38/TMEM64 family)